MTSVHSAGQSLRGLRGLYMHSCCTPISPAAISLPNTSVRAWTDSEVPWDSNHPCADSLRKGWRWISRISNGLSATAGRSSGNAIAGCMLLFAQSWLRVIRSPEERGLQLVPPHRLVRIAALRAFPPDCRPFPQHFPVPRHHPGNRFLFLSRDDSQRIFSGCPGLSRIRITPRPRTSRPSPGFRARRPRWWCG